MTDLPPPPIGPDVDLTRFPFMPLNVRRLRDSRFAAATDGESFRTGVLLWCAAWHQVPAGSLPDDDIELANLAGFGRQVEGWLILRNSALYGWRKHSDGRLYHPVIVQAAHEAWARREEWQEAQATRMTRQQRWRAQLAKLCGLLRDAGVTPPERPTKAALVELCRLHVPGFVDADMETHGDSNRLANVDAGDGYVDAGRRCGDASVDGVRRGETRGAQNVDGLETVRDIYKRLPETANKGTGNRQGQGQVTDTHTEPVGAREPGVRNGEARSPRDAWRDVTECDPQAYQTWLEWRAEENDVVPPRVRIQDAKFLGGKGTPDQQRAFVDELVRLRFKRLHDPIDRSSSRSPSGGGRKTFEQHMAALDADIAAGEDGSQ